jgi:hypothetical protein
MHDINLQLWSVVFFIWDRNHRVPDFPAVSQNLGRTTKNIEIVSVTGVKFEISCHPNWRTASSRTTDKRKWTQMRDSSKQSLLKISVHLRLSVVKNLCLNYDGPVWQRHAPSLQPLPVASAIPLRSTTRH